MTNLAFGGHFGFSLPTHLAHVEEMEVLWILAHVMRRGRWTSPEKFSFLYFFSSLNFIAPVLSDILKATLNPNKEAKKLNIFLNN